MTNNKEIPECDYSKVPIKETIQEKEHSPAKYGYGVRHIQLLIFLLCLTVSIIGRGHMGVTIVAMTSSQVENTGIVNKTILSTSNNYSNTAGDVNLTESELEGKARHVIYDWPKSVQEMVLNAFFLGYTIMMFPMGMVCQRFGGKLPLQIALVINGIVSIVTPCLTIWGGWTAACCCRILQGLSQAGTYPSVQALLAKWVPVNERATLSCCVYTGLNVGTVIAFHIAGFLGASRWGWPSIFYAIGAICLVCFILLTVFGAANPVEHKSITKAERNYIMGTINGDSPRKLKTPWRAIATSSPLWGTIIAQSGATIGFIFFFNQVPTYIHYILGVNVRNSGLLSSLPYVAGIFSTLGFAYCGIAFCLILTSYINNNAVAVACLVITLTLNMGGHTGWMINLIDLAPNFSGTLTAIGNTIANTFVVLIPIVISHVVTDMTNQLQWRIMFFIIAGITVTCNAIFVVLMSADVQPWNFSDYHDESTEKQTKDDVKKEKLGLS